jgi:AcrR family transcriptional regulator
MESKTTPRAGSVGPVTPVRQRAEDRRRQLVDIAAQAFARGGYEGTSTHDIAARAGVSQPYLIRLFGSKKQLFLLTVDECFARTAETFRTAAAGAKGDARLHAMGTAYVELLEDRDALLLQLQTYAACGDPEIQARVREGYRALRDLVGELAGVPPDVVRTFLATGMLLNVAAALDLPELALADGWPARHLADAARAARERAAGG